jgi:tetratricopeptide (TPR) repeat protein
MNCRIKSSHSRIVATLLLVSALTASNAGLAQQDAEDDSPGVSESVEESTEDGDASSQDAEPKDPLAMSDAEKTEEAKKAFGEGKTLFELGKFEEALTHFQRAYELKPVPLLLFNIGQTHRQLGNHQEAVFTLKSFLEQVPDTQDRKLVEDLIAESEKALKTAQEKAEQDRQKKADAEALAAAAAAQERERAKLAQQRRDAGVEKEVETPIYGEWWFWATVAAVAVVATGGIIAGVMLTQPSADPELPSGSAGTLDLR